jgi:hypothetical protein
VLIEVLAGLDVITTKEWTALHAELRYAVNQCKERRLLEATRVAHLKATA